MGVSHGRFHPSDFYCSTFHARPGANLRMRSEVSEEFFQPSAGVFIEDLSAEFGPEGIEVSVLGLDAEVHRQFFSHHVKSYQKQFAAE